MTIEIIEDEASGQFVVSIHAWGLLPGARAANIMDGLEDALPVIAAAVERGAFVFYAIDAGGKWDPQQGEFDPWENLPNLAAWARLARYTDLHPRIEAWLGDVESLLASSAGCGLMEHDEAHFGEAAAAALATAHLAFVPAYTRLLTRWDMEAEVMQAETITALVREHGITEETEQLLFTRVVEAPGLVGEGQIEELYSELQAHYGDFSQSELFEAIVEALHQDDREARMLAIAECIRRRRRYPEARPQGVAARAIFAYVECPKLKAAAARLLARLDAASGPLPNP